MVKEPICRDSRTHVPTCTGRTCGQNGRSERELPPSINSRWRRAVNLCAHAVHRKGWTPLWNRGEDCGMNVVVGVLAAASALAGGVPALPAQGLAISGRDGIAFVDLSGRERWRLPGLRFANDTAPGVPRFVDPRGRLWALDRPARRLAPAAEGEQLYGGATLSYARASHTWFVRNRVRRILMRIHTPRQTFFVSERRDIVTSAGRALDLRTQTFFVVPRPCDVAGGSQSRRLLLCRDPSYSSQTPRTIAELVGGRRRAMPRPPGRNAAPNVAPVGHWAGLAVSPDGQTLLAQWSAECESRVAYLVSRRTGGVRLLGAPGDEAIGLGWTSAGAALVFFPRGACGGTFRSGPGVYAFNGRTPRRIVATKSRELVAMWGG